MRHIRVIVKGIVQGVGFRYFSRALAFKYGISGFVRNLPDGSVEIEASGHNGDIEDFLKDIARGPSSSSVSGIDVDEIEAGEGIKDFEIRF